MMFSSIAAASLKVTGLLPDITPQNIRMISPADEAIYTEGDNLLIQTTITTEDDVVLVFDGNSITAGFSTGIDQYYPKEVDTYLTGKVGSKEFYSYGVDGRTLREMIPDVRRKYARVVKGKENILIAFEDINCFNVDVNLTAQQHFDDYVTYFQGAKDAGFQHCILLTGYYPKGETVTQSVRDRQHAFFGLVDASDINLQPWDYRIDLRNSPNIGGGRSDPTNAYFSDHIHLTAIGYDVIADEVIEQIKLIVKVNV